MNDIFQKFCYYLITKGNKEEYEEIKKIAKENKINFKELQDKTLNYVKEITKTAKKLGYSTDFESFSNMLEEYINKKEKLTDKKKKEYLKVLAALSEIYEINLKNELKEFISDAKNTEIINNNTIFNKFCLYNIKEDTTPQEYNELKELALLNDLDFNEINQKSLEYIEDIKTKAEEFNSKVDLDSFYNLLHKYLINKKDLKDKMKTKYLKVLVPLANIYSIDLKTELTKKIEKNTTISNPLENIELLKELLKQRYNNGSFNVLELQEENNNNIDYNSYENQIELIKNILDIIPNKELNSIYEDLFNNKEELKNITIENIKDLLDSDDESDLSKIVKLVYELTNYYEKHIGNTNDLFNVLNEEQTIKIHLNTSNVENTYIFINEYILKCIENNVSFNMIAYDEENKTILYANSEDIKIKIDILNELSNEHPELIKSINEPLNITARINDSYYGLSNNEQEDYVEYFNYVCEISYYRVIAKIALNKIEKKEDKDIVDKFISLKNIKINKDELEYVFNEHNFSEIKDLINRYIPDIINTLNMYMDNDKNLLEFIEEFKKSIQYIVNLTRGLNKKDNLNIAFNIEV